MGYEHPDSLYPRNDLAIILGLGEIGLPIYNLIAEHNPGRVIRGYDPKFRGELPEGSFQFMHICFPQETNFISIIREYCKKYTPRYVIIHSTVSPGMTSCLDGEIDQSLFFYSPVRGNMRDGMEWSLARYTKYVAAFGLEEKEWWPVMQHLAKSGFNPKYVEDPESLEWAKLLDLCWYGLNIAYYQELERTVEKRNLSYSIIEEFMRSTPEESEGRAERSVFYGGYIGGHCVMPAIEKVMAEDPGCTFRMMLRATVESNIKRRLELLYRRPTHHPI